MIVMHIPEFSKRKLHDNEYFEVRDNKFYIYIKGWLVAIAKEVNW